mmetsp:Transcript_40645/g.39249  ORF Transcript_40645/g.39249 Transcript_40645/m.39249 type:complete len:101 (+) Transcript_40645:100-402(+)
MNKSKFLNQFYVYSGLVRREKMSADKKKMKTRDELSLLECQHKWQVCLFDFTYKNLLPDYFCFRVDNIEEHIIEDYFKDQQMVLKNEQDKDSYFWVGEEE